MTAKRPKPGRTEAPPHGDRCHSGDAHVGGGATVITASGSFRPYQIGPGDAWMIAGLDWSWAFVVFKDVPGFPGYCVGTDGTVWSRWRHGYGPVRLTDRWRKLKTTPCSSGYPHLRLNRDGKAYTFTVHRLVLLTFVGPAPAGHEACHFPDPDRTNNRLSNLRWGTRVENRKDSVIQGRQPVGSRIHLSKLTEADVFRIREMLARKVRHRDIAGDFGVHVDTISLIARRKTWLHVQ